MLKIKWLGQSGYILTDGETSVSIDPYLSDVVNRVAGRARTRAVPIAPQELNVDAVICTHDHLDHIDTDSIPKMSKDITFFAPSECEKKLRELGVTKYEHFNEGMSYKLGEFEICAVFADHTVPAVGTIVKHSDITLYFSGDTYYNEKLETLECDIMFICINGRLGNMNVEEAVKLTRHIAPRLAIPNHYDMFESNSEDPHKFTDNIDNGFIMEFDREYKIDGGKLERCNMF